jgi:hypothetical protein
MLPQVVSTRMPLFAAGYPMPAICRFDAIRASQVRNACAVFSPSDSMTPNCRPGQGAPRRPEQQDNCKNRNNRRHQFDSSQQERELHRAPRPRFLGECNRHDIGDETAAPRRVLRRKRRATPRTVSVPHSSVAPFAVTAADLFDGTSSPATIDVDQCHLKLQRN